MGLIELASRITPRFRGPAPPPGGERAPAPALGGGWELHYRDAGSWTPMSYGEYYPRSALVYSAIRARQDAVVRAPLVVYRRPDPRGRPGGASQASPAGPDHPAQRLLDSPNPHWARADLWRATETYMGLWGSAYWALERNEAGEAAEIWPLRPDRMRVVPDVDRYVRGFVYAGKGRQLVAYVPEDVVWLRYFNPLDEYAGMSPVAPLRLSVDMGIDALRASRNNLANDSSPGMFIESSDTPTDDEVREFYNRWEARFKGVDKVNRPVLLGGGMKAANLGFSPKDMEYVQSLRWSLEDVSRVYGVPKAIMGDIERVTFSNYETARRVFWEDTIVPQLIFYQEALRRTLLASFEDGERLFAEFDLSVVEALRESENDRAERRRVHVESGVITINEARAELGLPPVAWGDGPG